MWIFDAIIPGSIRESPRAGWFFVDVRFKDGPERRIDQIKFTLGRRPTQSDIAAAMPDFLAALNAPPVPTIEERRREEYRSVAKSATALIRFRRKVKALVDGPLTPAQKIAAIRAEELGLTPDDGDEPKGEID